jgi:hypothetical protein
MKTPGRVRPVYGFVYLVCAALLIASPAPATPILVWDDVLSGGLDGWAQASGRNDQGQDPQSDYDSGTVSFPSDPYPLALSLDASTPYSSCRGTGGIDDRDQRLLLLEHRLLLDAAAGGSPRGACAGARFGCAAGFRAGARGPDRDRWQEQALLRTSVPRGGNSGPTGGQPASSDRSGLSFVRDGVALPSLVPRGRE